MILYRGVVDEVLPAGPVVSMPRRFSNSVGPLPSTVGGLVAGDRVLVADGLDGLPDSFVVVGKLV